MEPQRLCSVQFPPKPPRPFHCDESRKLGNRSACRAAFLNRALVAPQEIFAGSLANPACLHIEQEFHLPNTKDAPAGSAPKQFLNQPVQIVDVHVINLLVDHHQNSGPKRKKFFGMFTGSKPESDRSLVDIPLIRTSYCS